VPHTGGLRGIDRKVLRALWIGRRGRSGWRESAERRRKVAPFAVAAAACALAVAAGWNNSATGDESCHTLAAFTYLHDGHGDLNLEHPPLARVVAGLPLQAPALAVMLAGSGRCCAT